MGHLREDWTIPKTKNLPGVVGPPDVHRSLRGGGFSHPFPTHLSRLLLPLALCGSGHLDRRLLPAADLVWTEAVPRSGRYSDEHMGSGVGLDYR